MKRLIATIGVALALVGAACGSDSKPSTAAAAPKRIVSMSSTSTEMLFAIGANKQVVAVDDQSNYPATAPKTKLSAYEPNVEAIAAYKPDLVIIAGDTKGLKAQLEKLAIPVVVEPAAKTLEDSYTQLADLGKRTGHEEKAASVAASIRNRIDDLRKEVPARATPLTYYHELDNTLFTVTSKTFIGEIYSLAGLKNVADAADPSGQSQGYPQLSAEFLVKADPDLIFLADTRCCAQTRDTLAARAGFGSLKAVKNSHVIGLDDDIASRWGPRIVEFLKQVVAAVKAIPQS